ncbi:hypothetical protein [Nocardia sp. CA-119907]|uniref:hypothetical protein n=1 Tax=Nocardia sp. CA-119907 TaxID=3239973 RepID=UPI003D9657AA
MQQFWCCGNAYLFGNARNRGYRLVIAVRRSVMAVDLQYDDERVSLQIASRLWTSARRPHGQLAGRVIVST